MVIQIDDAHPSNGTNTAILLNGKPLELLETYDKAAIEEFFKSLDNRETVRIYISDLAPFLLILGRTYFREALIVADPYHVVLHLFDCFDLLLEPLEAKMLTEYIRAIDDGRLIRPIRAKKAKSKQTSKKTKAITKAPTFAEIRILLRTKINKLDDVQRIAAKFLIEGFPDVRAAYFYLQRVQALYHTRISPADASKALDKFEAKLPPQVAQCFWKLLDLCRQNRDTICAFWACGWSNSEAEAQNGVINDIDRRGRYLKFPELRRRWLYGRSASTILGRSQQSFRSDEKEKTGPPKKKIRELRTLPSPEPVPVVGLGGERWLFDPLPQKNERLDE